MSENEKPLPKPTNWDELFPGRFLKAGQLKGKDVTLTIADVFLEKLPRDKGGEEVRGILAFRGTDVQLALNKTNGICLKAMLGAQVQAWVGKRVTIYPSQDHFGRELVDCIRVRGSPDIERDMTVEVKLPKKKARQVTLTKTGQGGSAPQEAAK